MTLQDYISLVTDSFGNFFNSKNSFVAPVIASVVIFIVGLIVATILRRVWEEIVKFLNLEKNLVKIDAYAGLVKTHKNLSVTELLGSLIWWTLVFIFLLPALKALNLAGVDQALGNVFAYLPQAVIGGLYLLVGFVVAWFSYLLTLGVGTLVKVPASSTVAKVVSAAVVVASILLSLRALGVSEEMVRFMIFATLAASALAFGLAGKDVASDLLKKVRDLVK